MGAQQTKPGTTARKKEGNEKEKRSKTKTGREKQYEKQKKICSIADGSNHDGSHGCRMQRIRKQHHKGDDCSAGIVGGSRDNGSRGGRGTRSLFLSYGGR